MIIIEAVGVSWTGFVILRSSLSSTVSSWSRTQFLSGGRPGVIQIVKITLGQRFEAITSQEIVILDNSK